MFLEHMIQVQDNSPQGVYDTLLELRLQDWAHEENVKVRTAPLYINSLFVVCWQRMRFFYSSFFSLYPHAQHKLLLIPSPIKYSTSPQCIPKKHFQEVFTFLPAIFLGTEGRNFPLIGDMPCFLSPHLVFMNFVPSLLTWMVPWLPTMAQFISNYFVILPRTVLNHCSSPRDDAVGGESVPGRAHHL